MSHNSHKNRICELCEVPDQKTSQMVKYVVIIGQRYGSNPLLDVHIRAICFYAGQDTSVPEPEEADGTSDSMLESLSKEREQESEDMILEANDSLTAQWTGPWPVLHLILERTLSSEVSVEVAMAADLLGSASIEYVDFKMDGFEDLSEDEANGFIALVAEKTSANSFWNDVVQYQLVVFWAMLLILEILAMLPVVLSNALIVTSCLITISFFMWLMWSMVFAVRQMQMSNTEASWTFLTAALTALGIGIMNVLFLHWSPLGFLKAYRYFSGGWARLNSLDGYHGRANVIVFFTMLVLIAMCIVTYYGMTVQWW